MTYIGNKTRIVFEGELGTNKKHHQKLYGRPIKLTYNEPTFRENFQTTYVVLDMVINKI